MYYFPVRVGAVRKNFAEEPSNYWFSVREPATEPQIQIQQITSAKGKLRSEKSYGELAYVSYFPVRAGAVRKNFAEESASEPQSFKKYKRT
jgi:hypothetical protein